MFGDFPLQGKIVAITGGGSGIGLAFAKRCHSQGSRVVIGDLKLSPQAQSFVDESRDSRTCLFTQCDVAKWSDLQGLIDFARREFGDVPDVYCPCAGVFEPTFSNYWSDIEQENHYQSVAINVEHPLKFTRLAIRALVGMNKKGVVLLVASVAGLYGTYAVPMYCATKHAIVGFVKSLSLADELEGIKVVGICPGIVGTPLWDNRPKTMENYGAYGAIDPLTPEEVAISMGTLVQEGKHQGGTVFLHGNGRKEVVVSGTRIGNTPFVETAERIHAIIQRERGTHPTSQPCRSGK
ncbi:hypothetical protein LOY86_005789 [Ophidiomyces ophidiicola]|nr:hypothetical protein LOZ49_000105 [Ophidiomyces ophidiicola]KAI2147258.1 hypothetical protein LOZ28_000296 [Ophidiomyces ophidiicola]KAI2225877.1 hypothetical protein LOZ15_000272 [Ophidiomyces ophidiicola]KAI2447567.1 hypothetical protein LOZ08_000346 [Ophidiomyces ophidiicola]KAI2449551.1 hypothetical protein LOY86_005789 [Ophidiomyces ophidiicola]